MKTLGVRMDRHCANAQRVVELLHGAPGRSRRCSTRPAGTPGTSVAAKQMRDFGGMVSFLVADEETRAARSAARTQVFTLAESLGGVESLIEHPAA